MFPQPRRFGWYLVLVVLVLFLIKNPGRCRPPSAPGRGIALADRRRPVQGRQRDLGAALTRAAPPRPGQRQGGSRRPRPPGSPASWSCGGEPDAQPG
jgi:hypothetical protein